MSKPPPVAATTLVSPEDRRLIQACLGGQGSGWEEFIDRFSGLFSHVAVATARQRGIGLEVADREDLVAEIVLACLRNQAAVLQGFAGRSSLATYLTVVARRVTGRRLRWSSATPAAVDPIGLDALAPVQRPEARRLDDREHLEACLGRLDRDEARLVRLHHLEARSYGEISRATGLPLGSIGPALSRARAKLRVLMDQAGQD